MTSILVQHTCLTLKELVLIIHKENSQEEDDKGPPIEAKML